MFLLSPGVFFPHGNISSGLIVIVVITFLQARQFVGKSS